MRNKIICDQCCFSLDRFHRKECVDKEVERAQLEKKSLGFVF